MAPPDFTTVLTSVCPPKSRLKRILFFTYSFRFHWFHDYVLPRLQKAAAGRDIEITVIANVVDTQEFIPGIVTQPPAKPTFAKQWNLKDWCSLGESMRIFLVSENNILHNKIILAEYDRRDRFKIGMGSANLTHSGWISNLEFWDWPQKAIVSDVHEFLEELQKQYVPAEALDGWLKVLPRVRGKDPLLWLYPGKRKHDRRTIAFSKLLSNIKDITTLRIVSPYFDDGSKKVMKEILSHIKGKMPKIELWFDYKAIETDQIWLEPLVEFCEEFKIRKLFYPLKVNEPKSPPIRNIVTLHGKLIEALDNSGCGKRILGSANFTGAAWYGNNWESILVEPFVGGQDFHSLIKDEYDLINNTVRIDELKRKLAQRKSMKDLKRNNHSKLEILWAAFDEKKSTLFIRYNANQSVVDVKVEAAYDELRDNGSDKEELARVKLVADEFKRPDRWDVKQITRKLITWHRKEDIVEPVPETLSVGIFLADGTSGWWPIITLNPVKSKWDSATGIPKGMETALEALVGDNPIATPVGPNIIVEDNDEFEEEEEEESNDSMDDDLEPLTQLSADPQFNHLPDTIKMLRLYKQANTYEQKAMVKRLYTFVRKTATKTASAKENLIARAFLEAIKLNG